VHIQLTSILSTLIVLCAFPTHGNPVEVRIDQAGNAPSDAARLISLRALAELPMLPEEQRLELAKFIPEVERYLSSPRIEYFSRPILDTEDYDFGIPPASPLYPLTYLYRARMLTWVTLEYGGYWKDPAKRRSRFDLIRTQFEQAHAAFPEEPLARMYLGEPFPGDSEYPTPEDAPEWAVVQREGLERLTDIIHWWIDYRLQPDGQYGGGWGDDCEMWRFWTPILMGFEDPKIRKAQEFFSTALLRQKHMQDGYTDHVFDVEHTSEDSSDAITPMLHLAPDNEVWQARAMRIVELSRDLWMGRNDRNQYQYKSTYFSVNDIDLSAKRACDTVYHPRTLQSALLLWQRNHDPELTALVSDWMNTWVDAAARAERGKPAGVIPSAIHWPDGSVGGIGEHWWDPENHSSDPLYVFPSAMPLMTHTLLQTYHITGDGRYLAPLRSMAAIRLDYVQHPPETEPAPGTTAWCAMKMGTLSSALSKYRLLTGSTEFDTLLQANATTYARYRFWGDDEPVVNELQRTATALGTNFRGFTSEVRYTDRVLRLPSIFEENGMYPEPRPGFSQPQPDLLYATVTGDPGMSYMFPMNAVRWKTPARNLAAFVTESGTERFSARLYHFGRQARPMGATLFLLNPGNYRIRFGNTERSLVVEGPRTEIGFTLPPQTPMVLSISRLG